MEDIVNVEITREFQVLELPNLIEIQTKSYDWFLKEGLLEMFRDISPIEDFTGNLSLEFVDYRLGEPKYDLEESKIVTLLMLHLFVSKYVLLLKKQAKLKNKKSSWVISINDRHRYICNQWC